MMKTALSIIQRFRRRTLLPVPSTLIGVTDPDELQLIEILYAVCEELRQARCWTQQKREHEFTTVSGQGRYKLPKDFYSSLLQTHWNKDESNLLIGPISDGHFTLLRYGDSPSSTDFAYRIFGPDTNPQSEEGQVWVDPVPSSAVDLYFEYISRNLFVPAYWQPGVAYLANAKVFVNGNIYNCSSPGVTSLTNPPSGKGTAIVDGGAEWGYYDEPYETILLDNDLCIFDDDLVKLGLRAKWYQEHDGDWESAEAEFRSKIDQAVARYYGPYVGCMAKDAGEPGYSVPYKGWSI